MSPQLHKAKLVEEFFRESGKVIIMARDMNLDKRLKKYLQKFNFCNSQFSRLSSQIHLSLRKKKQSFKWQIRKCILDSWAFETLLILLSEVLAPGKTNPKTNIEKEEKKETPRDTLRYLRILNNQKGKGYMGYLKTPLREKLICSFHVLQQGLILFEYFK